MSQCPKRVFFVVYISQMGHRVGVESDGAAQKGAKMIIWSQMSHRFPVSSDEL